MRTLVYFLFVVAVCGRSHFAAAEASPNAALVEATQATAERLGELKADGYTGVVLLLDDSAGSGDQEGAARRVTDSQLDLYYWIEIGRNRALADAHPELMASLQTHSEWRRHFPQFPKETADQVVKNYPWVPVLNKEGFDAHLKRTRTLLETLPPATGVFLNHLQGAPSACGCGNSFCRWTADYGPKKTATPLGSDAASLFVAAVKSFARGAEVIPVWTTECAEHDGGQDGACAGVPCFRGLCWKEYAKQITPVASQCRHIGILLPFEDFPGKESKSGGRAQWQNYALNSFSEILQKNGGPKIAPHRLIAVVQGWKMSKADIQLQRDQCKSARVPAIIVALARLDSSWQPRLLKLGR